MLKMGKKKVIIGVVLLIVGVVLVSGVAFAANYISVTGGQDDNKIAAGISIGAVDVSGMTKEEAYTAIDEYVHEMGQKNITLTEEESGGSVEFSVNDLGLACSNKEAAVTEAMNYGKTGGALDKYNDLKSLKKKSVVIDMEIEVSGERVEEIVSENSEQFETPAVEASLEKVDGEFVVTPGQTGVVVDVEASVARLNEFMSGDWDSEAGEIALIVETDIPKVTTEDLESVKDVLGTYNTNFGSSDSNRATNVKMAAEAINGALLLPGEEYSMVYDAGPFDQTTGYLKAGAYQDGEVIQSYGGGICQVSTTLFNALLEAEVEITERHEHSMTVGYVPWGMDAAIAGTYKDLRFKNNYEKPIYVEGYTSGGILYFTIYGEETRDTANRTVTYQNNVTSQKSGDDTFTATGAEFGTITKVASGQLGGAAELYKIVTENGVEVSRELIYTSSYRATGSKYEVGTGGVDDEISGALKSAISSNDKGKIDSAIAEGKQKIKDKEEEEKKAEEEKKKEEEEKRKAEEDKKKAEEEKKKAEEDKKKAEEEKKKQQNNENGD